MKAPLNWEDPGAKVSKYFTVHEALWLPSWRRHANEKDGVDDHVMKALVELFFRMDLVQEHLGRPITVHVAYRPYIYNKEIGGSATSAHMARMWQGAHIAAVDFSVEGMTCDEVRAALQEELAPLGMRMEDLPGSSWVHLDTRPPSTLGRFFKP